MKNCVYLFAILITALISCSKGEKVCCEPISGPQLPEFYVYSLKDDSVWVGTPVSCYLSRGQLYVQVALSEEKLNLSIYDFKGVGQYKLAGTNCFFYDKNGIDYYADLSPVNSFEVTEYNETTGILSGTLTVNLKIRMPDAPGNPVPEIYFSKGRFRLALSK